MKKILLSSFVAIAIVTFLTGCGEDKQVTEKKTTAVETKVEVEKVATPVVEEKTPETKLVDQVKESTNKLASQIAEESKKVAALGSDAVKSVSEKVVAKTEEVTKDVVSKAVETKDKLKKVLIL